jgi:hypothetical protein
LHGRTAFGGGVSIFLLLDWSPALHPTLPASRHKAPVLTDWEKSGRFASSVSVSAHVIWARDRVWWKMVVDCSHGAYSMGGTEKKGFKQLEEMRMDGMACMTACMEGLKIVIACFRIISASLTRETSWVDEDMRENSHTSFKQAHEKHLN